VLSRGVHPVSVSPVLPTPVTLNSFQGPSGLKRGVVNKGADRAAEWKAVRSRLVAGWILKRVQDDEQEMSGAAAPRVEFIR